MNDWFEVGEATPDVVGGGACPVPGTWGVWGVITGPEHPDARTMSMTRTARSRTLITCILVVCNYEPYSWVLVRFVC